MQLKAKHIIYLALSLLLLYLFWGPLFPWSPLKVGYEKIKTNKATETSKNRSNNDSILYKISEIIREEEEFH